MCGLHGESIRRSNQRVSDSRFRGRMTGIGDNLKMGFGPSPVQGPGGFRRGDHIISALDNYAGQPSELACLRESWPSVSKKPRLTK